MEIDDNSVNIKSDKMRYHHGDLRAALVAEGLRLLAQSDAEHLSLREIARNVGVSATAVYRHFPDKEALLKALCVEGDKLLESAQRAAQAQAGGGQEGFVATGRTYVRFALANPALFRLMNGRFKTLQNENKADSGSAALPPFVDTISRLLFEGAPDDAIRIRTVQSWAIVHGLSMMMLDGILPPDEALIEEVIAVPAPKAPAI